MCDHGCRTLTISKATSLSQDDLFIERKAGEVRMAKTYSIETPVHVNSYWRFRLYRWEHVDEYWRSLPLR